MRIALFADIHANEYALTALTDHLAGQCIDGVWFLGDMVGRGYQPGPVVRKMRVLYEAQPPDHRAAWVIGNHDLNVMGRLEAGNLGGEGTQTQEMRVLDRVAEEVDVKNRDLLRTHAPMQWNWLAGTNNASVPAMPHAIPRDGVYVAHGVYEKNDDGTINLTAAHSGVMKEPASIRQRLRHLASPAFVDHPPRLVLGGHTHLSMLWTYDRTADAVTPHDPHTHPVTLDLADGQIAFLNPGSAAFSREPGRMGTYAVLETTDWQHLEVKFHTLHYDAAAFAENAPGWYPAHFRNAVLDAARDHDAARQHLAP